MIGFFQRNGAVISIYLLLAVFFWVVMMIVLPQAYMLNFSFRHDLLPNQIGGPEDVYTLSNYEYLLFGRPGDEELFNYLHLTVFLRTIVASIFVTLLDFALCYPIAYYIAQVAKGGYARSMILLLILPFWVNEILRAFDFDAFRFRLITVEHAGETDRPLCAFSLHRARERQHLRGQRVQHRDLAADPLQLPARLFGLAFQQLCGDLQARQRRTQFVRHVAEQLAAHLELGFQLRGHRVELPGDVADFVPGAARAADAGRHVAGGETFHGVCDVPRGPGQRPAQQPERQQARRRGRREDDPADAVGQHAEGRRGRRPGDRQPATAIGRFEHRREAAVPVVVGTALPRTLVEHVPDAFEATLQVRRDGSAQ